MNKLVRRKRLHEGTHNVEIVEIKGHTSKTKDEGVIIKFKVEGSEDIYTTRISMKANFLMNELADTLCGEYEEISYSMCKNKKCVFDIKINKEFINLIGVKKLKDTVIEDDFDESDLDELDYSPVDMDELDFDESDFDPVDFEEEEDLI